jgi:hypothetical protein
VGFPSEGDILFLLETVLPERDDRAQLVGLVRDDADFVEALLGHDRVFERLTGDDEVLLKVTPQLFFAVLLRRARRDLDVAAYTLERRQGQRVALFDTRQAARLLEDRSLQDYLAAMLASFTRVHSATWRVRVRKGVWRRQRFNDLDVDSLIRYGGAVEEEQRFEVYRRIGDVCLFLAGMFPEYIESRRRYALSGAPRPAFGGLRRSIEDYEREGRAFYGRAAGHSAARSAGLSAALGSLAEHFQLAEKPLSFLSEHYLQMRKNALFDVQG